MSLPVISTQPTGQNLPARGPKIVGGALIQQDRHALNSHGSGMAGGFGFKGRNNSGVMVDHDIALTYGDVWKCVKVIAEDIGILGWHVFEPGNDGRTRRRDDATLAPVLRWQANPEMTAQTWRETIVPHALLFGNGYAEIERNMAKEPIALWPLLPDRTKPVRHPDDGRLLYASWSSELNQWIPLPAEDVFHLKGLGFNGLIGYDVISYMSGVVGMGIATEQYSAAFFGNGTHLSGGLFHPNKLDPEAREHLRQEFEKVYRGSSNSFKMAVFEGGLDWKQFSVTPEAARVIESRKYQRTDVAGWFRVKPHKIGDLENSSVRSNIESENISHVQDTLLPWVHRLEQEAYRKLLVPAQRRRGRYTKLNIDSLRRGDIKTRYQAYKIGREWGWLNANRIADMEDQDPVGPAGDVFIVPLNYQNAEALLNPAPQPDNRPAPNRDGPQDKVQQAKALRPAMRDAVERIHNRERHRANDLMQQAADEFGRRLAALMEDQRQYARQQLSPLVISAFSLVFSDVPVTDTGHATKQVVDNVLNSYVSRQTEFWRSQYPATVDTLPDDALETMLNDVFENLSFRAAELAQHLQVGQDEDDADLEDEESSDDLDNDEPNDND